jgi:hypothetical protein
MKDAKQKAQLYRHFMARGWYALPEIPVFYKGGVFEQRRLVTDIDVLALRPSSGLEWELVLGDCKTLKDHSPANRAVWLRGLMAHFSARSGIIILKRKPIDQDHKLFASSFGVTLLDEEEFEYYDRALIYPEGSKAFESNLAAHQLIRGLSRRYPRLVPFTDYIFAAAWNEGELLSLLRRIIGEARGVSTEIDPKNPGHLALILEAGGVFAIGLAHCVGIVFNQFLQLESPTKLDEGLKLLIWGGRTQYEFIAKLRNDMIASKGKAAEAALTLPEWDRFLELVREMLEYPALSFRVPQLLHTAAGCVMNGSTFLPNAHRSDLLLLKYAMLTMKYVCRAGKLPPDVEREITTLFVVKQSTLVHERAHPNIAIEPKESENERFNKDFSHVVPSPIDTSEGDENKQIALPVDTFSK